MRLLLFCPTYRLEPETVSAILAQTHRPLDLLFTRDNPHGLEDRGRRNILHNFRKGRRACLDGGYDGMMVVESDIIPPADCIEKLLALDVDAAYGLYAFRVTSEAVNVFWRHTKRGVPGRNPGSSITGRPEYRQLVESGATIECSGAGTGCVLVKRRVLEEVDFRLDPSFNTTQYRGGFPDTYFTRDVYSAGYTMAADLSVVCGHKHENGEILWPPYSRQWHESNG